MNYINKNFSLHLKTESKFFFGKRLKCYISIIKVIYLSLKMYYMYEFLDLWMGISDAFSRCKCIEMCRIA